MFSDQKVKDRIKGNGRTRLENDSDMGSMCNDSSSSGAGGKSHRTKPSTDGPQTLLVQNSSGHDEIGGGDCSPLSINIPPESSSVTTAIMSPGIDRTDSKPLSNDSQQEFNSCSLPVTTI